MSELIYFHDLEPAPSAFGVYVHWPFCAAKCPYCDFNSHVRHNSIDQNMFAQAYVREIEHMASISGPRTVSSIFFGGGTPSLMEPKTVATILEAISKHWHVPERVEISMEANPTSVDATRFKGYREAGVDRVSLGVQSLHDKDLKFLGRLHSGKEAMEAIKLAQKTFDRMSFDLIYARPGQTLNEWEDELKTAIDLAAGHLSLYQLTIEQGTPFFDLRNAGKLNPLDEEPSARLYELTQDITRDMGYDTYEISNHARQGEQCAHNLVYWRGQDYAGIGPGAHGRLKGSQGRLATATFPNPEEWWQAAMTKGHGMDVTELLDREEVADEYLLMGLRLAEGIRPEKYASLKGAPLDEDQVVFLKNLGLIETTQEGRLRATPQGFLLLDSVVADLGRVPDPF